MKRILLVSPHVNYDVRANWIPGGDRPAIDKPGLVMPLGLATVAALTPSDYQVDIWDESIRGKLTLDTQLPHRYDLVGITGYVPHLPRVREVARVFRERNVPVAVGGPGVSTAPHLIQGQCDFLFVGETELTWPQFLRDWEAGRASRVYRQVDKPDLASSPRPRWDGLGETVASYANGSLQTTRGCPFDCEFCDVIYLYGRRQRHKPVEHVLDEVRALERMKVDTVFVSDDEFIGDPRYAKELLRALIPVNNSFENPLRYRTQLTMNVSRDDELLELMADANFDLLIIGIETPNKESLRETNKPQNIRRDLVADVHKILSYGLGIRPGMIVGFDHDGPDIFDVMFEFIQSARLPLISLNMLKAPLGTRLWTRMRSEGRMLNWTKMAEQAREGLNRSTNIVPAQMSRVELMRGYCDLARRINSWDTFGERVRGMVSLVARAPQVRDEPMPFESLTTLGERLEVEPEGCEEIRHIFEHVRDVAPFMWRKVRSYTGTMALFRRTLPRALAAIEDQAEAEASGRLVVELEKDEITLPPSFARDFKKKIFPPVYRRVFLNLKDRALIAEALVEIFVDFLIHWKDGLDEITLPHVDELLELADRTCAHANGVAPELYRPETSEALPVDKPVLYFQDEVLKSVAQELIAISRGFALREVPSVPGFPPGEGHAHGSPAGA